MMLETDHEIKLQLEAQGLFVSCPTPHSFWIAATLCDTGDGIKISDDACSLICKSDRWIAVFSADGMATYEVPGNQSELLSLISKVYNEYRQSGGRFKEACRTVIQGADQYLIGGSLAHV